MWARWGLGPLLFSLAGACSGNGGSSSTQEGGAIGAGPDDAPVDASSDAARETLGDVFRGGGIDAAVERVVRRSGERARKNRAYRNHPFRTFNRTGTRTKLAGGRMLGK